VVVKKDWGGEEVVLLELSGLYCDKAMGATACGFHALSGRDNMMYGLDARTGMLIAA